MPSNSSSPRTICQRVSVKEMALSRSAGTLNSRAAEANIGSSSPALPRLAASRAESAMELVGFCAGSWFSGLC
jgi:hypothetical protein